MTDVKTMGSNVIGYRVGNETRERVTGADTSPDVSG
jgi:hypothetical protein